MESPFFSLHSERNFIRWGLVRDHIIPPVAIGHKTFFFTLPLTNNNNNKSWLTLIYDLTVPMSGGKGDPTPQNVFGLSTAKTNCILYTLYCTLYTV